MKEVKMRRYQNLLTISGLGVIAFGAWSVLKTILYFFLRKDDINEAFDKLTDDTFIRIMSIVIIALILLIDFGLRLYVGLSARAEGFGKKKGVFYLIVAIFIAVSSLLSLVMIFFDLRKAVQNSSVLELVVSIIVETTSMIVMIELLVGAFTVKKLRKDLEEVQ